MSFGTGNGSVLISVNASGAFEVPGWTLQQEYSTPSNVRWVNNTTYAVTFWRRGPSTVVNATVVSNNTIMEGDDEDNDFYSSSNIIQATNVNSI